LGKAFSDFTVIKKYYANKIINDDGIQVNIFSQNYQFFKDQGIGKNLESSDKISLRF
jgi:hypothetical protein